MNTSFHEKPIRNQSVFNKDQTSSDSFHKKLPFPSDPDMGENNPLVTIPDIRDETHIRHSNESNSIESVLMQLQNNASSEREQNESDVQEQGNNPVSDEIIYPSSLYRPVFGDADSNRNEFSTED